MTTLLMMLLCTVSAAVLSVIMAFFIAAAISRDGDPQPALPDAVANWQPEHWCTPNPDIGKAPDSDFHWGDE